MQLTKQHIGQIKPQEGLVIPGEALFTLPEKVLQFGTGVLLRGLPDYFIDKANRAGIFNGRVAVVKSTATGGADAFDVQDGLYTLCVRGLENGQQVEETIINSSVSRVLAAKTQWDTILEIAASEQLQVVISNTTEVGISLVEESIDQNPPASFPAKLLAVLYHRYKAFNGDATKGLVILPTELITDNGIKLQQIVLQLAAYNKLEDAFVQWLQQSNYFCNTLVDRIVPGKLAAAEQEKTTAALGYTDELMIMSEVYRLWAIETDNEKVKEILSFSQADKGVVLTDNIIRFKELKLRLLNGSHTFTCAYAILQGFTTVKEAMNNETFYQFINGLMKEEIIPALDNKVVPTEEAVAFANNVLDRYKNPYLEHQWLSIAVQYTSKMFMRNVPLIIAYAKNTGKVPEKMAIGFAAYLLLMNIDKNEKGEFEGQINDRTYTITCQYAEVLSAKWKKHEEIGALVEDVLSDTALWGGNNLLEVSGFAQAVKENVTTLIKQYFSSQVLI